MSGLIALLRRWAAPIAFWAHMAVLYIPLLAAPPPPPPSQEGDPSAAFGRMVAAVLLSCLVGPAWAATVFRLSRSSGSAARVLMLSQTVASALFIVHGVLFAVWGMVAAALVWFAAAAVDALWMRRAAAKAAYVNELLQFLTGLLAAEPRWLMVVGVAVMVQTVFLLAWSTAAVRAMKIPGGGSVTVVLLLLVSLRWVHGVIKHTLTAVISGHVMQQMAARAAATAADNPAVRRRVNSLTLGVDGDGPPEGDGDGLEEGDGDNVTIDLAAITGPGGASRPGHASAAATLSVAGPSSVAAPAVTASPVPSAAHTPSTERLVWSALTRHHGAIIVGAALGIVAPLMWTARRVGRAAVWWGRQTVLQAAAQSNGAAADSGGSVDDATSSVEAGTGGGGAHGARDKEGAGVEGGRAATVVRPSPLASRLGQQARRGDEWSAAQCCRVCFRALAVLAGVALWRCSDAYLARCEWLQLVAVVGWSFQNSCHARRHPYPHPHPHPSPHPRAGHKYTFVPLVVHGRRWGVTAQRLWAVFARRGVDGVIDDDVTDRLLAFGGAVGGGTLLLLLVDTLPSPYLSAWLLMALVVFVVGWQQVALPLVPIEAAVSTALVSFVEAPEVLAVAHPLIYHRYHRLSELYVVSRRGVGAAAAASVPSRHSATGGGSSGGGVWDGEGIVTSAVDDGDDDGL